MRILLALAIAACSPPPPPPPRLPVLPATLEPTTSVPQGDVAVWRGGRVTGEDLEARIGNRLRNRRVRFLLEQYEVQAQALDILVIEALLEEEVERRGMTDVDTLLRVEVDEKVTDPTEEEIAAFWPVIQHELRGATLEEGRPVVVSELVRRGRERRYAAFVEELRTRSGLQVLLPYPELPRAEVPEAAHDPSRGPADAPVTIVQFAEYQCYYCGLAASTLDRLQADYGDKVRLVWKDYPLSSHGRAIPAAVAAHCAGEQGRYWELNRTMLDNQGALTNTDIVGYASDLGMDTEAFQTCWASGRYEASIAEDQDVGQALGVELTPTFFINGVLLSGAHPYELFAALVDRELARDKP